MRGSSPPGTSATRALAARWRPRRASAVCRAPERGSAQRRPDGEEPDAGRAAGAGAGQAGGDGRGGQRLDGSAAQMFAKLRELHGVDEAAARALQHRLQEKFVVQQAIDTPQAGMAGAATGAAMGASVDLLVGGLTLGAATALGALVGGSAAFIAAAWKNRATPSGTSARPTQRRDDAGDDRSGLAALPGGGAPRPRALVPASARPGGRPKSWLRWRRASHAAPFWTAARTQPDAGKLSAGAGARTGRHRRRALATLYPSATRPRSGSA